MPTDISTGEGSPKPRTRGPKHRPTIDFGSMRPVDYTDWAHARGLTPSQARRRKRHLPTIVVVGLPLQIIPAEAEAVLRGEDPAQLPRFRRGRGRPRQVRS